MTLRLFGWVMAVCALGQAWGASDEALAQARALTEARERPSMFVTVTETPGLRTVADVRRAIESGHGKKLWDALKAKVDEALGTPVIAPVEVKDGERTVRNRSYGLVSLAAARIQDAAFVGMITEDRRYVDDALKQIMALFDENQWPEWSDQAHLNAGLHADLRHGQLVVPVALAYDWLYPQLTGEERQAILDGVAEHAIAPYKEGFAAEEHWSRRRSNWMTVVLGGFGIAGMALGPDCADSTELVTNSLGQMEAYLDVLGPDGEFNESVQYAGSMMYVVRYFTAMRYASGGVDNPFDRHSLTDFYHWYMHMTFPPGRVAGFGDPAVNMPPVVVPAAAVAAATQDPALQWFYEQYHENMLESHRDRALELLFYDADLEARSPDGLLPLGRAYEHQGKLVSSRSSWDAQSAVSVVYGKAGREDYHNHADWGQLCIDGYGVPLIVDLGAPSVYPKGGVEHIYNYQQFGHNVFVIGDNDTGGVSYHEKKRTGRYIDTSFDEHGAAWTIDLSEVYGDGAMVTRTVVHMLPRIVAVLDVAELAEVQPVSMRWHVGAPAAIAANGTFVMQSEQARLAGAMVRLGGEGAVGLCTHAYAAPYDTDRYGNPFEERKEPYLSLTAEDRSCRVLSLFAIVGGNDAPLAWQQTGEGWMVATPEGAVHVTVDSDGLSVGRTGGPTIRGQVPAR